MTNRESSPISLYDMKNKLSEKLLLSNIQTYIPIIECVDTSCSLPLERKSSFHSFSDITVIDKNQRIIRSNITNEDIFCKYAPLVDPVKFLMGKYDSSQLHILPSKNGTLGIPLEKIGRRMNSAYIDALFCSISQQDTDFIHGIKYHGTYLGIKQNFVVNIEDDIELLSENEYFHDNINKMFSLDYQIECNGMNSMRNRPPLCIEDGCEEIVLDDVVETLSTLSDENRNMGHDHEDKGIDTDVDTNTNTDKQNVKDTVGFIEAEIRNFGKNINEEQTVLELNKNETDSDSDSDGDNDTSSVISAIDNEEMYDNNDNATEEKWEAASQSDSSDSDESDTSYISASTSLSSNSSQCEISATINEFPVAMIMMEKCSNTLEHYINVETINKMNNMNDTNDESDVSNNCKNDEDNSISSSIEELDLNITSQGITNDEWKSILFQVLMILVYYQKHYQFTHNDLHSCNIMYNDTDIPYIVYKHEGTYFKVPTYGKIYKIIDFGRSIFTYNGQLYASDSFNHGEDAHTQYNCEPFFDTSKARIEPNMSFDLCRLGCSLFDYFIEDMSTLQTDIENCEIAHLIYTWTLDDQDRNVLYRKNGEERYPEFKLYKMISRNVHRHVPKMEINKPIFNCFRTECIVEETFENIVHV